MAQLLLETILMNSFVGEDSWVYVRVADGFVRKKARDLNIGDMVVVNNEGIDKTIEEVEPILMQSQRYASAYSTLYRQNRLGEDISLFRILLLEGLVPSSHPNRQQKIMRENDDFNPDEYRNFRRTILGQGVTVGEDSVRRWLNGETLAPDDWNNFSLLAHINPAFQNIAGSLGQQSGYHGDYKLYVGMRSTIMGYLAKRTGGSGGGSIGHAGGSSGKFTPEIDLVVRHFLNEVDDDKSAARIARMQRVSPSTGGLPTGAIKPDPGLSKGIYTGQLNVPLLDVNELFDMDFLLSTTLGFVVVKYIRHLHSGERPKLLPHVEYITAKLVRNQTDDRFLELEIGNVRGITRHEIDRLLEERYNQFMNGLRSGKIERLVGAEPNTVANLIDLANQYKNSLPACFLELVAEDFEKDEITARLKYGNLNKKERKNLQRRVDGLTPATKRLREYIRTTYGIEYFTNKVFLIPFLIDQMKKSGVKEESLLSRLKSLSDDDLRKIGYQHQLDGAAFYSRIELSQIYQRLGIPGAIKFIDDRNFICD